MKQLPKGIKIEESESYTKIEANNYETTLLLMQIFLMLFPLLGMNGYFLYSLSKGLFITIPLLLALVYWMIYNIKDKYIIMITKDRLEITKGMDKCEIVNMAMTEIKSIWIKRKTGKVLTSARTAISSKTPDIIELRISTDYSEILVTNSLIYSNQLFIKEQINKRLNQIKSGMRSSGM